MVEPVDVIIGGSPCQGLSVAGNRDGLNDNRSQLFLEQIRLVKEMRIKHNKPNYMVWENVVGALSSNKGEDFRVVLEEICMVKNETITIPRPQNGKWSTSGCILGDGFSVGWRVLDSQYFGVCQRRRRISLIADFDGHSAPEILHKQESLSGYSSPQQRTWQTPSCYSTRSTCSPIGINDVFVIENHPADSRVRLCENNIVQTLTSRMGTGGGNVPMILHSHGVNNKYVRKLTPLETERLQGFPDDWTFVGQDFGIDSKEQLQIKKFTDKNGKLKKVSDNLRYTAIGNSICLPPWRYVLKRLCEHLHNNATMGDLFSGIGGFILLWQEINGKDSVLWSSEIDDFPLAVLKEHFGE